MRGPLAAVAAVPLVAAGLWAQSSSSSAPAPSYWMRLYPLASYSEIWRVTLEVPDLEKALARAAKSLDKRGARSVLPLENMAASAIHSVQQLSYRVPSASAAKALADIQKLGLVQDLQKNPALHPGVGAEAREKKARLDEERLANREALERMPAVGAAVAEIAAHLEQVDRADREASQRVLLNIELRQKPGTKRGADARRR